MKSEVQHRSINIALAIGALLLSIVIAFLAAVPGAFFTPGSWYAALEKPFWNPPGWVFGPVWTALYTMMGVASWLVWPRRRRHSVGFALGVYGGQLILNALWTVFFFGLENPALALVDIALLLAGILWTILLFWKISYPAALLLVPYMLWVGYASTLNTAIWWLN